MTINTEKDNIEELKWIRKNGSFKQKNSTGKDFIEIINNDNHGIAFKQYADNFHEAAKHLMNHIISETMPRGQIQVLDTWYFSTIFLYRHSLELILKALLFKQGKMNEDNLLIHDLTILYNKIYYDKFSKSEKWLKNYINNITLVDKASDMFRFPFTQKLDRFFEERTQINYFVIQKNMEDAYEILNDIFCENIGKSYDLKEPIFLEDDGGYYELGIYQDYNNFTDDYYLYIEAYISTGKYLKTIMEKQKYSDIGLFLPMCYLYRNAIELYLKRMIHNYFPGKTNKMKKKGHSILGLWNIIMPEVKSYADSKNDKNTLKSAEVYINQLHSFDFYSTKFRYPIDKNMNFYFDSSFQTNVDNMTICFEELFNFLSGLDSMYSAKKEIENEYKSESLSGIRNEDF